MNNYNLQAVLPPFKYHKVLCTPNFKFVVLVVVPYCPYKKIYGTATKYPIQALVARMTSE
jgi:hypothetical protein